MTTIPAKAIVNVTPNVLNAGGSALDLSAMVLTTSTRVPIGTVQPFPTETDVADYFGESSNEVQIAQVYFNGFDNSNVKPGSVLYTQYPEQDVPAYIRSGSLAGVTLAQLRAISGNLTITMDGYDRSGAVNLSGITSPSDGANTIQTAVNGSLPTLASVTGSIAGTTLTVTAVGSGNISLGAQVLGTGVTAGTYVTAFGNGTGGNGTYTVNHSQTVGSEALTTQPFPVTVAYDSVTSSYVITSGITGAISTAGYATNQIAAALHLTSATGAVLSQGAAAATPEAFMDNLTKVSQNWGTFMLAFDPDVSGNDNKLAFAKWTNDQENRFAFVCWDTDASPTVTVPATNSLGQRIKAADYSGTCLIYEPANAQQAAFTASITGNVMTVSAVASGVLNVGQTVVGSGVAIGTIISGLGTGVGGTGTYTLNIAQNVSSESMTSTSTTVLALPAFICGIAASIDFEETNGRTTFAFRSQTGLSPSVTDQAVADNLIANGYNFYGAYATAAQDFVFLYPGSVSGPFEWMDSYINQIWLNNGFQLALMELLVAAKSIPYNSTGYGLIEAAASDVINAGLNFGAFRPGITLSAVQIAEVNNAAGKNIAQTLQIRGWYFQVKDASPQVRAARGSPPCTFWYVDGQSVQRINLTSIELQ